MKYLLLLLPLLVSCASVKKPAGKYITPKMLAVTGDFNGDGVKEKISSYVADSIGNKLKKIYDPYEWDDVVTYYSKMGYYTAVNLENGKGNTLTYYANGLFCLINIGDNNNDGKDEIALVPALLDYSNLNSCLIYSLCNNEWQELTAFWILEDSFYYAGNSEPIFTEIVNYLEYKEGQWMFWDYKLSEQVADEDIGKMVKLVVPPCAN